MRYSFDAGDAPTTKERQYYAMLGTRGMWEKGWKAVTVHGPTSGIGHFDHDQWELYHLDEDRAEAHDLAAEHPDKLKALIDIWFEEAEKYDVLPLDDRRPSRSSRTRGRRASRRASDVRLLPATPPRSRGGRGQHPRRARTGSSPRSRSTSPDAEGVIFAHGSRFGGHALFLKDRQLHYVYNFLGIPPEQDFASETLEPGRYVLGMEFTKESRGEHGESHGHDEAVRRRRGRRRGADARRRPATSRSAATGCASAATPATPVSSEYRAPATFTGGTIRKVEVNVGDDAVRRPRTGGDGRGRARVTNGSTCRVAQVSPGARCSGSRCAWSRCRRPRTAAPPAGSAGSSWARTGASRP